MEKWVWEIMGVGVEAVDLGYACVSISQQNPGRASYPRGRGAAMHAPLLMSIGYAEVGMEGAWRRLVDRWGRVPVGCSGMRRHDPSCFISA